MKKFSLADYIVEPNRNVAKRMIYTDNQVIAFVLNIAEGAALPSHTHFDCTVLLMVINGTGDLIIDGETVALESSALIQLDGQENMSIQNKGNETLTVYVTISPAPPSEKYAQDVNF